MIELGYQIVVSDVKNMGNSFEDWYIDSGVVKKHIWESIKASDIEYTQLYL